MSVGRAWRGGLEKERESEIALLKLTQSLTFTWFSFSLFSHTDSTCNAMST